MNIFLMLAPASVLLAALGLWAFSWTLRDGQYEDPKGDAARILAPDVEDRPL